MCKDRKKRSPWDDFFFDIDEDFEKMRRRMDRILENMMSRDMTMDPNPLIYGFSMRVGPDGKPRIQEFGNAAAPQDSQQSMREPLTDVIQEEERIRVVVELPGVEKDDIHLDAKEDSIDIEVDTPTRRFSKHLEMPCDVDPESAKATYNNGVLEVCLKRVERQNMGKRIEIE